MYDTASARVSYAASPQLLRLTKHCHSTTAAECVLRLSRREFDEARRAR